MLRVVCVIPARLQSVRFPRKILASLGGRPLLQCVWQAACDTRVFDEVIIAVDAEETAEVARGFGATVEHTSRVCTCGTDRLVELAQRGRIDADVCVNWQGDEPFICKDMITTLLRTCHERNADVWTLMKQEKDEEQIRSPHCVKVTVDSTGSALYFSRSAIPYYRDVESMRIYYKHIGIYAYSLDALKTISRLPPAPLEKAEQLEQLRFLYYGLKIQVHETNKEVLGIDLPEHLVLAEEGIAKFRCPEKSRF